MIRNIFYTCCLSAFTILFISCDSLSSREGSVNPQSGAGGSMARFAITGNSLYVVGKSDLSVYDISVPDQPKPTAVKKMDMGVETIFPYQNMLFVGANDGLYIFDNQQPTDPKLLSKYVHIMSCDPVVAQNNYAYVTLRAGRACGTWFGTSTLDIIDISNPSKPSHVNSLPMEEPYGLGVSGHRLFVCEGQKGLKVFDISAPKLPLLLYSVQDMHAYDVIPQPNNTLILTGQDGIFQMAFNDDNSYEVLSTIPVE